MKTQVVCALVIAFFGAKGAYGAALSSSVSTADRERQVTVSVYDYAAAGPEVLLKAERVTAAVFQRAGVSIVWLACPTSDTSPRNVDCANLAGSLKFILHVVTNSMAKRLRQKADVFGVAALGGEGEFASDAWIFYDQIKDPAVRGELSLAQILGNVIAHELGHLLLGTNSHSSVGLMRARWSREELLAIECGQLVFSVVECERIQRAVIARRQAASASIAEVSSLESRTPRN
jgi:hypothetical protein